MITPTGDWNQEYIAAHPDGYLASHALVLHAHDRERFIRTCCSITVEAILWKIGVDIMKWEPRDVPSDTFAIEFDEGEHIALVHQGHLYQSFYKKTEVACRPVTPALLASLRDPVAAWKLVVGDLSPLYVPNEINILY